MKSELILPGNLQFQEQLGKGDAAKFGEYTL